MESRCRADVVAKPVTYFDYARSAPPEILRRALEFRIPERVRGALTALALAALVVAGAWLIEAHRLQATLQMESIYRTRFDASERALRQTHVYEERVKRLLELDAQIQSIRRSGTLDARRLAEISNALPAHAWLTSIAQEGDAIALEGRAEDLRILSAVMRRLMQAHDIGNPALVNASLVPARGRGNEVKYALRLDGAGT